jgi:hypothetical protein
MAIRSAAMAGAALAVFAASGWCVSNYVAFRPLIAPDDLEGKKFDSITVSRGVIYVWKMRYIAERDIERIDIYRSAQDTARLLVGFKISADGAKRLRHFTAKFGPRHLAIFVDGRLLDMIPPAPPSFLGDRIVVRWPGTEKELRLFASRMNKKPPGMFALYIEEMGRYNDVAADAWASAYADVNRFIEEKMAEAQAGKALVEELRDSGE